MWALLKSRAERKGLGNGYGRKCEGYLERSSVHDTPFAICFGSGDVTTDEFTPLGDVEELEKASVNRAELLRSLRSENA